MQNREVFIIGGGSSLQGFNFSRLRNKDTIAVNMSALDVPNPTYCITADSTILRKIQEGYFKSVKTTWVLITNPDHCTMKWQDGIFRNIKNGFVYNLFCVNMVIHNAGVDGIGFSFADFKTGYNSGFCFDNQTKILTENGWRYFEDLNYKDKVLSMNPKTDIADYYPVKYIHKYDYDGQLIVKNISRGHQTDFAVTPDHNMFVYNKYRKKYQFKVAKYFIKNPKSSNWQLKTNFKWVGKDPEYFYLDGLFYRKKKTYKIRMDLWLEFLGWYLSEGTLDIRKNKKQISYRVSIFQKQGTKKCKEIEAVFNFMPFKYEKRLSYNDMAIFRINNNILGRYIETQCKQKEKKQIPSYIRELSPKLISVFLQSYLKGDGYKTKTSDCLKTVSRKIAYDILELFLKVGYQRVNLIIPKIPKYRIFPNGHKSKLKKIYQIIACRESREQRIIYKPELKYYKGKVYDVTVEPFHTIFVKRKGMPFWSGNCGLQLAILLGYNRIYLLGFDLVSQTKCHYHDRYKGRKIKDETFHHYYDNFAVALKEVEKKTDIQVLSCSSISLLNDVILYVPFERVCGDG